MSRREIKFDVLREDKLFALKRLSFDKMSERNSSKTESGLGARSDTSAVIAYALSGSRFDGTNLRGVYIIDFHIRMRLMTSIQVG
jgi:hypothetical protein